MVSAAGQGSGRRDDNVPALALPSLSCQLVYHANDDLYYHQGESGCVGRIGHGGRPLSSPGEYHGEGCTA